MSRHEICPSCGTKLGASQSRAPMRTCSSCHRSNPPGYNYCGFCATPMENTEMRARMIELAAPPGGWPNLTGELVEVRFYLQQGLFDDAYELLSIMQKRHPGHPQLAELSHRPKPVRRVDTDTLALVDSVLAESANLVGKMPRRAAPRWKAPAASSTSPRTAGHQAAADREDDVPTQRPARTGKTGANATARASTARGTGAQREAEAPRVASSSRAASGSQRAAAKPSTGSQRAAGKTSTTGAQSRTAARAAESSPAEPAAPRERTRIYRTVEPPRTVAEARAAELERVEAARASEREQQARTAERAKAARAAERAEAARLAEQATARRAAERELAARTTPGPRRGSATVAVDALQPPAPFTDEDGPKAAPKGARKRREPEPPRAAAPNPAPAEAEGETEQKEARKRRASFGEHVLNRLR